MYLLWIWETVHFLVIWETDVESKNSHYFSLKIINIYRHIYSVESIFKLVLLKNEKNMTLFEKEIFFLCRHIKEIYSIISRAEASLKVAGRRISYADVSEQQLKRQEITN